jgi:hypothetical protein
LQVVSKNLNTLLLKGLALCLGQGIVFVADIYLDDVVALKYYSFMNSMVLFAVLSSGTFTQKFSQLYQSNRETSLILWFRILISWNIVILTFAGIFAVITGKYNVIYLCFCGFSLSLSALYSENQRINNRINASIVFPELARSILLILAFWFVLLGLLDVERSITLIYIIIGVIILTRLPISDKIQFKISLPDWRILLFGVFYYFLVNDIEFMSRFYPFEQVLVFARLQKFISLQILIIEMWYFSKSHKFLSKNMVYLDRNELSYLTIISILVSIIFSVANVVVFGSSWTVSLIYLIGVLFTQFVWLKIPGKIISQLFGYTNRDIIILVLSVLFFWSSFLFHFPLMLVFLIWTTILTLFNLAIHKMM